MRVLVLSALLDDFIVGLRHDGNKEIEQNDEIEELVEEPNDPDHVNHELRVIKSIIL